MRKIELEKLLERAVAEALGVSLPASSHRRTPARLPRHARPGGARIAVGAARHRQHAAEQVRHA